MTQLQWHFGLSASEEHGPKDSITTTFKGNKYYSLAREVLQNSLDAISPEHKELPVTVSFSLFEIEKKELPTLFNLDHAFKACKDYYSDDKVFGTFCDEAISRLNQDKIKCLRISDYNTTGLVYNEGKCPFYAFMKAVGYNLKASAGSGGSFGFGKGAYYAASSLRTIIVSSIYGADKHIFQGKTRLTTHKVGGELKDYTGHYSDTNGAPIKEKEKIPTAFRRSHQGTDIIIVGFEDESSWKDSLIKSVVNNFWLAIYENRLIVEVEGTTINQSTLEKIISNYYQENTPDGSVSEPETWNPYPYFKAVKFASDPNARYFEKDLTTLGKVKLHLILQDNYPNRIVYMREPRMVVFKKTENRGFNYAGVFVCTNKDGNHVLREMENPQHNEWKKNNYLENDKPHPDAKSAEEELKSFIRESFETLKSSEYSKRQKITGLEQYLYIPDDLIADESGDGQAEGGSAGSVHIIKNETAVERTVFKGSSKNKLKTRKPVEVIEEVPAGIDDDAEDIILTGIELTPENDDPNDTDTSGGGDMPGGSMKKGVLNGPSKFKRPLPVKLRLIGENSDFGYVHVLRIFSNKAVQTEMLIQIGLDSRNEDEELPDINSITINTHPLSLTGNRITDVPLAVGWNDIRIIFDSPNKYSIKVKAYEL